MNWRIRLMLVGVGVVAVGVTGMLATEQVGPARAVLVLSVTDSACVKTLVGNDTDAANRDRIRARRGGAVQWTVINNCDAQVSVALVDWVRKADRSASYPFNPNGRTSCDVASGQQCVLTLAVRPDAAADTYSYGVSIDGVTQDPDLIIEDGAPLTPDGEA